MYRLITSLRLFSLPTALFATSLLIGFQTSAQECRDATPAERQIVEKMVHTFQNNITPALVKDGWSVTSEHTALPSPQIAKSPGPMRPLMICNANFELNLQIDPATAWGKKWVDSVTYYQQSADPVNQKNFFRLMATNDLFIRAYENDPYQNIHISPVGKTDRINVPGTSLALQYYDPREPNRLIATLYFGDWKSARISSGNDAYSSPYPFHHPGGTPFIVNLVISVTASPSTMHKILMAVDWSKINEALTP
jgi:hypothetical protein